MMETVWKVEMTWLDEAKEEVKGQHEHGVTRWSKDLTSTAQHGLVDTEDDTLVDRVFSVLLVRQRLRCSCDAQRLPLTNGITKFKALMWRLSSATIWSIADIIRTATFLYSSTWGCAPFSAALCRFLLVVIRKYSVVWFVWCAVGKWCRCNWMELIKMMGLAGYQRSSCSSPLAQVLIKWPQGCTVGYYHSTGESLLIDSSLIGLSIELYVNHHQFAIGFFPSVMFQYSLPSISSYVYYCVGFWVTLHLVWSHSIAI